MSARTLLAACLLLTGTVAVGTAGAQTITVEKAGCVPSEDNGLIRAAISSPAPGLAPRLYFRWREHEDFYWVALEAEPGGRFWAIPPKPETQGSTERFIGL